MVRMLGVLGEVIRGSRLGGRKRRSGFGRRRVLSLRKVLDLLLRLLALLLLDVGRRVVAHVVRVVLRDWDVVGVPGLRSHHHLKRRLLCCILLVWVVALSCVHGHGSFSAALLLECWALGSCVW